MVLRLWLLASLVRRWRAGLKGRRLRQQLLQTCNESWQVFQRDFQFATTDIAPARQRGKAHEVVTQTAFAQVESAALHVAVASKEARLPGKNGGL